MFSEKLNFLIEIANVKNSDLATAVSLDASHISRLRGGSRKLPSNQTYVMPMARYFAKRITDPFHRKIVSDAMHFPGEWPKSTEVVAEWIFRWLTAEDDADNRSIDKLITGFANAGRMPMLVYETQEPSNNYNQSEYCYYGSEGKQAAILRFLTAVYNEATPQTLLLFSDEEMSWLYGDPDFSREWARLLIGVLRKGNRIKIIHTVSRDLNEMTEAVIKWVPVYMTGAIESYYYPKLRDGLFQKTLFIAPKTAAILSSSVKQNISRMLNLYIDVPDAVKALVTEYERYLSLCRPLIDVMNTTTSERFFNELYDFNAVLANGIMLSPVPSIMTMPESIVDLFAEKAPAIKKVWEKVSKQLDTLTEKSELYEIILPPTEEQIAANAIPLPMNDFYRAESIYYTVAQYKEHLENVLKLTKDNPHYHAVVNTELSRDVMIYAKEDTGIIMAKPYAPTVVFTMREPNLTAAFWSYMQKQIISYKKNKDTSAWQINDLLNTLIEK